MAISNVCNRKLQICFKNVLELTHSSLTKISAKAKRAKDEIPSVPHEAVTLIRSVMHASATANQVMFWDSSSTLTCLNFVASFVLEEKNTRLVMFWDLFISCNLFKLCFEFCSEGKKLHLSVGYFASYLMLHVFAGY